LIDEEGKEIVSRATVSSQMEFMAINNAFGPLVRGNSEMIVNFAQLRENDILYEPRTTMRRIANLEGAFGIKPKLP
jgi:hypothetical protein